MIKCQQVIKVSLISKLLLISKQADAQAPLAPRVSALNARETDDRHGRPNI